MQVFFPQIIQAVLQDIVQHAGAEGVTGAGGLDDPAELAGRLKDLISAVVGVAAVSARGHVQETDVRPALLQHRGSPVEVLFSGHEEDLIIRDFQDVALSEAPGDLLFRRVFTRPERRTPVRIEGDQRSRLAGQLQRTDCCAAAGLVRQGQRSEVEDPAGFQQVLIQFICPQQQIRARFPIETEVPVSVGEGVDDGQGRRDLRVPFQAADVDAGVFHRVREEITKAVLSHLADERGLFPQLLQHGQHIRRGSAGIGFEQGISLPALSVPGEVDQQFSQRNNIKLLHSRFRPLL